MALPHALKQTDYGSGSGLVNYRLKWQLPSAPDRPQAAYVSKMSLSGRLYVNGQLVGDCGNAPLEELRCLHQPQFFRIPALMLRAGENTLDFEIFATERQMNGLSAVRVGDAGQWVPVPVASPAGWHVVQLDQSRPYIPPELDKVRPQLAQAVLQRRLQEKLDSLRRAAKID